MSSEESTVFVISCLVVLASARSAGGFGGFVPEPQSSGGHG